MSDEQNKTEEMSLQEVCQILGIEYNSTIPYNDLFRAIAGKIREAQRDISRIIAYLAIDRKDC